MGLQRLFIVGDFVLCLVYFFIKLIIVVIDNEFYCSLEEFIQIETKLEIQNCFELYYDSLIGYLKQDVNSINKIETVIAKILIKIIKNKTLYIQALNTPRNLPQTEKQKIEERKRLLIAVRKNYLAAIDYIFNQYKAIIQTEL